MLLLSLSYACDCKCIQSFRGFNRLRFPLERPGPFSENVLARRASKKVEEEERIFRLDGDRWSSKTSLGESVRVGCLSVKVYLEVILDTLIKDIREKRI